MLRSDFHVSLGVFMCSCGRGWRKCGRYSQLYVHLRVIVILWVNDAMFVLCGTEVP